MDDCTRQQMIAGVLLDDVCRGQARRLASSRPHLADPEDLLQDTYRRLCATPRVMWTSQDGLRAYITRALHNAWCDLCRADDRRHRAEMRLLDQLRSSTEVPGVTRTTTTNGAAEAHRALDTAMHTLRRRRPETADVMTDFLSGRPVNETAARLGVSPSTVIRRRRSGVAWLRRQLCR